jgi:hypothetical protein
MTFRIAAVLLAGVMLAPSAFAQSNDGPPNAVGDTLPNATNSAPPNVLGNTARSGTEDRSLMGRSPSDPLLSRDPGISYAFKDSFAPPEGDGIVPMAPRSNNLADSQAVDRATVK